MCNIAIAQYSYLSSNCPLSLLASTASPAATGQTLHLSPQRQGSYAKSDLQTVQYTKAFGGEWCARAPTIRLLLFIDEQAAKLMGSASGKAAALAVTFRVLRLASLSSSPAVQPQLALQKLQETIRMAQLTSEDTCHWPMLCLAEMLQYCEQTHVQVHDLQSCVTCAAVSLCFHKGLISSACLHRGKANKWRP